MPIFVKWGDDEKQTIIVDYEGHWEWNEFFDANKETVTMMETVSHRVDIVANMKSGYMPTTGASFTFAKNAFRGLPAHWGVMVIVTNLFIGKLVDIFKQLDREFKGKIYTASSIEQAREVINQQRARTSKQ